MRFHLDDGQNTQKKLCLSNYPCEQGPSVAEGWNLSQQSDAERQPCILTPEHNLESSVNLTCMCLYWRGKLKHWEKPTEAAIEHSNAWPISRFKPITLLLWDDSANHRCLFSTYWYCSTWIYLSLRPTEATPPFTLILNNERKEDENQQL